MKLFVWADPYRVLYGSSGLFIVAETIDEARELAKSAPGYKYVKYRGNPDRNVALGEPTRIVDLPCAEWHEWSE